MPWKTLLAWATGRRKEKFGHNRDDVSNQFVVHEHASPFNLMAERLHHAKSGR
jgi:hypothetical protein